jgi:hypothetical protein
MGNATATDLVSHTSVTLNLRLRVRGARQHDDRGHTPLVTGMAGPHGGAFIPTRN